MDEHKTITTLSNVGKDAFWNYVDSATATWIYFSLRIRSHTRFWFLSVSVRPNLSCHSCVAVRFAMLLCLLRFKMEKKLMQKECIQILDRTYKMGQASFPRASGSEKQRKRSSFVFLHGFIFVIKAIIMIIQFFVFLVHLLIFATLGQIQT